MRDLTAEIASPDAAFVATTGAANPFSCAQINQLHLLRASAGTGKTYSIQTLYLRLILVEGLTVQQILVVTFTKDATKELRDRLQHVLREALDLLAQTGAAGAKVEARTQMLVDMAQSRDGGAAEARKRLQVALLDFDMAAIYTIHGFCQRVLGRFAFETGQLFEVEPSGSSSDEIEQLCRDWWRKNVYALDEAIAGFLGESGAFALDKITALAKKLIAKPDVQLVPAVKEGETLLEGIIGRLQQFVAANPASAAETGSVPNAATEIGAGMILIQGRLREFRQAVEAEKWATALEALRAATAVQQMIPTGCEAQAAALLRACQAFMAQVPKGTQARTFQYDAAGALTCGRCQGLTAGHTFAVRDAALALKLPDLEAKFKPLRMGCTEAYVSTRALCGHFAQTPACAAEDLFKAIRVVQNDTGVAMSVSVTVESIAPSFQTLLETLREECGLAVCRAALAIREMYRQGRPAAATASFDDYLLNLRAALRAGGSGGLVEVLRAEFRAALIDEFQDTDPVQWGIFEPLFRGAGVPCFLVGDPKQAIYRFRNGDVETFQQATAAVAPAAVHELDKNHRSEQRLIDAVNQIFLDGADRQTFGEGIAYAAPLGAAGKAKERSLLVSGKVDEQPFKIKLIENQSKNGAVPGICSATACRAYQMTAHEIARILQDETVTMSGRRVRCQDIAVLVSKHREGEQIAQALAALNIPTVRQGTGDVWDTAEGRTLWQVLEAVLEPRNLSHVRCALLSAWFGMDEAQIQRLNAGDAVCPAVIGREPGAAGAHVRMEDWVAFFEELRKTWLKRGFPAMFRKLAAGVRLKERLLGRPDRQGQRRLANINHLCELVEQTILHDRKTPEGTLSWVRCQFDKRMADGGEAVTLRLESDDDAVRIMTIFASKGLEFPVVFAPTLFMIKPVQKGDWREFHQDLKLYIGGKDATDSTGRPAKEVEKAEMEREQVRQIYVALTRAVHRTVVVALNEGAKNPGAGGEKYRGKGLLGEVLRLPMKQEEAQAGQKARIAVDVARVGDSFANVAGAASAVKVTLDDEGAVAGGEVPWADPAVALANAQAGTVLGNVRGRLGEPSLPPGHLQAPGPRPQADISRGHSSFSSLLKKNEWKGPVAAEEGDAGGEDEEAGAEAGDGEKNRDGESREPSAGPEAPPEGGIFAFPSGERTGLCWHEIFEELAFDAEESAIRAMVTEKLKLHGFLRHEAFQAERTAVTMQMVRKVLCTELPGLNGAAGFTLATIGARDRKTEWAFSFAALTGKRTAQIKEAVAKYSAYHPFTEALGAWDQAIPGGYLTGFVDLLFRQGGRYYLVDWKSNRRGGRQADFGAAGVREEMARHCYWLQYLIYSVAVHQYLRRALPEYCYERHFGGAYYIFLRGVDGKREAGGALHGVYADRPPEALVQELSAILGDFS
jgi:exodeoxyribonuclease V beta subunit